jgi:hypothetical protein
MMTCKTEATSLGGFRLLNKVGGLDFLLSLGVIPVDYYLERKDKGVTTAVLPLPNQPSSVDITKEYTETPVYTFADNYAYREIAKARTAKVVISGESGQRARLGIREDGTLFNASGLDHLKAFDRFLSMYFCDSAQIRSPRVQSLSELQQEIDYDSRPYIVFRALDEGIHGRASVESFTYKRDAGTHRLGYSWELTLKIYDPADPSLGNVVDEFYADVNAGINEVTGVFNLVDQTITALGDTAFIGAGRVFTSIGQTAASFRSALTSPITAIESAFTLARNFGHMVESFVTNVPGAFTDYADYFSASDPNSGLARANRLAYGFEYFIDSVSPADTNEPTLTTRADLEANSLGLRAQQDATNALADLLYNYQSLAGYLGLARERGRLDSNARGFLATDLGYSALASLNAESSNAPEEARAGGLHKPYILKAGESLLTIANRFLGSPLLWTELAEINRAQDAYTDADGIPYRAGSVILIPVSVPNLAPMLLPQASHTTEDAIAVDLLLDLNGDLLFNGDDAELVSGEDNLRQAVINRIRTATDDITAAPRYGLRASLVGAKLTEQVSAYMTAHIREQVLLDPRVLDVRDITLTRDGSRVDIGMLVYCINDIEINLLAPL